jgi:hypothetical protein
MAHPGVNLDCVLEVDPHDGHGLLPLNLYDTFVTISSKRSVAARSFRFNQMDAGRHAQICGIGIMVIPRFGLLT